MVFSQWDGDRCVAATPVRVDQLGELAELVVSAFARSANPGCVAWPAPTGADVVALDPPVGSAPMWRPTEVTPA